jgi:hypothetical protein
MTLWMTELKRPSSKILIRFCRWSIFISGPAAQDLMIGEYSPRFLASEGVAIQLQYHGSLVLLISLIAYNHGLIRILCLRWRPLIWGTGRSCGIQRPRAPFRKGLIHICIRGILHVLSLLLELMQVNHMCRESSGRLPMTQSSCCARPHHRLLIEENTARRRRTQGVRLRRHFK